VRLGTAAEDVLSMSDLLAVEAEASFQPGAIDAAGRGKIDSGARALLCCFDHRQIHSYQSVTMRNISH
jgi:hypothetical protein